MDQSARDAARTSHAPARVTSAGGSGGAIFLFIAAFACAGAAGTLAFAERLHPSGEWFMRRLAEQGVQPGLLFLAAGIALLAACQVSGLGRFSRRIASTSQHGEELLEKVGGQVVVLRRSLHDFRAEVVWLREAMTGLSEVVRDHMAQADAARIAETNKGDAVYHIAASLDQLGARVDGRFQHAETEHSEGFARIEQRMQEFGQEVEERLRSVVAEFGSYEHDTHGDAHGELGNGNAYARGGSREVEYAGTFDDGYVASEDDLHVEVTFEAPAAEPTPARPAAPEARKAQPTPPAPAPAPAPAKPASKPAAELDPDAMDPALYETSLGLLDAFDDYGDYRPQSAAPAPAAPSASSTPPTPPAPLPGKTNPSGSTPPAAKPTQEQAPKPGTPDQQGQSSLRITPRQPRRP